MIVSDGESNDTFKNLVIATTGGDAIQLGWTGGGSNDTLDGADIIHFTAGDYYNAEAAIGSNGYCAPK